MPSKIKNDYNNLYKANYYLFSERVEKMKYEYAEDLQTKMIDIVKVLDLNHIDINRVKCFRSFGSSTKRTIARCHTIGKLMQKAIGIEAYYAIEFLERFSKMNEEEQNKVIIHELMHIPKTFGGGFRQHDFVCDSNVELMHEKLKSLKKPVIHNVKDNKKISNFPFWSKSF